MTVATRCPKNPTDGRTRSDWQSTTATARFFAASVLVLTLAGWCQSPSNAEELRLVADELVESTDLATSPAETLTKALDQLFTSPQYASAHWGVRVESLRGGQLYNLNGAKQFIPASNLKIYTSAAALNVLGPDFRFQTRLHALGKLGADGLLHGDLVLVGSGDPSLGAWHPAGNPDSRQLLPTWVTKIKAAGIREIQGRVIGDGRVFSAETYSPHWTYGDLPYWYAAGPSGLAMEENCFRLIIRPGESTGELAQIRLETGENYVTIDNRAITGEAGSRTTADVVWRAAEGNRVRIDGTIALDSDPVHERGTIWDGTRYAASLLHDALVDGGVSVERPPTNVRDLPRDAVRKLDRQLAHVSTQPLIQHPSPAMSQLIATINKPSHNFFADQILQRMGTVTDPGGQSPPIASPIGSFATGAESVRHWLEKIGAPDWQHLQMFDGSGLARRNQCQPRQTTFILRHLYADERLREPFLQSLPIAGREGTLSRRMQKVNLGKVTVHAKTGYIGFVRCLSGYVLAGQGQGAVFSMMVNHYTVPTGQVNDSQDEACAAIAAYVLATAHDGTGQ